jgi:hypothetical protein
VHDAGTVTRGGRGVVEKRATYRHGSTVLNLADWKVGIVDVERLKVRVKKVAGTVT